MAFLVSDVTAFVRDHLPDFPPDSDPRALTMVNEVQSDILRACRLYPLVPFDIHLVAGQQEYALDPTVYRILDAHIVWSATWMQRIWETSIDELDYDMPSWRIAPPSRPYRYYEEGGNIGLYPPPAMATSGSYPVVRLYTTTANPFVSTSSSLPSQAPSVYAWGYGVCNLWATRQRRDDAPYFSDMAQSALDDLIRFINGRLVRKKPTVRFFVPRVIGA